jgi:oligopeptide transport system substrate-binding protein
MTDAGGSRSAVRTGAERALAASALLVLSACGQPHSAAVRPSCPTGEICLVIGNDSEPTSLDPHKISLTSEDRVVGEMFVGLTQSDASGATIPGVATRWETSPDGLTWTFHLRDADWSDGVPVTADDFVFSLRRLLDPATASEYAALLYVLKNGEAVNRGALPLTALGVRALDAHTLEIHLEHPAPYLTELTKHETMYPVPRHVIERWGAAWTDPSHDVTDGPYKLAEWRFGQRVRLVRNPHFWEASSVCVDQIDYLPAVDSGAAEKSVRRGEMDAKVSLQSNRAPFLRQPGQMPAYVRTHAYLGVYYLALNTRNVAAFRDRRVRLALSLAVDRDFMTAKLLRAGQTPAYTFVPPGVANYVPPSPPAWSGWSLQRRQAAARALLAQAGYGPGHPLTIEFKHTTTPDAIHLTTSIQSDWQAIGVITTLTQEEPQIAFQDYRLRDFQVGFAGWIADYDDPKSFLYVLQSSTGPQNYGDYHSARYDALLAAADQEPDVRARAAILQAAERTMLADAPVIPLYFPVSRSLVNPRITGWTDNIADVHRGRYLCVRK